MNAAQQPTLMRIPMRTLSRQTRYALEGVDDILVYKVAMTTRFRGARGSSYTDTPVGERPRPSGTTTIWSPRAGWPQPSSPLAVSRRCLVASSCPST